MYQCRVTSMTLNDLCFINFVFFFVFFLLLLLCRLLSIDDSFNRHCHVQQLDSLQDIDIFHSDSQVIVWSSVRDVDCCHSFIETNQSKTKEKILVVIVVVVILVQIAQDKTRHKTLVFWAWRFCRFFHDNLVDNLINVDDSVTKVLEDRNVFEWKIAIDTNKLANVDKTIFQYLTR